MTDDKAPLDTAVLLADIAAWWDGRKPDPAQASEYRAAELGDYADALAGWRDRAPRRIAGSEWDQQIPGGTQNPYWEVIRQLPLDPIPFPWQHYPEPTLHWMGGDREDLKYFADRFAICPTYSWSICTPGDITWLGKILEGRGVVEAGAGTGYWAWQMEQAGISVAAYEPNLPGENGFARREWTTILRDDYSAVKHHPDRALFLCWPSYDDPWAAQALSCYAGDLLIYAGEGEGGCTADSGFFQTLGAEWDEVEYSPRHVTYWGIHDYLTAYQRKGKP